MQTHSLDQGNRVPIGFVYHFELEKDGVVIDEWEMHNIVPLAGLNYMGQAMFGDIAPITTFYLGLFENNYLPAPEATAADLPSVIGEFTGYSEATRPIWQRVHTNGVHTNEANRAAFTVTTAKRLYGGFLVSSSAKAGATGTLLSVTRFDSPKDVEPDMVLRVRGSLSLIPTNIA